MRIDGAWALDEHGVLYPFLSAELLGAGASWVDCTFLVDTGAESTVIAADVLHQLGLPTHPPRRQLRGVGGVVSSVSVDTEIKFRQPDGQLATVRHVFDAFTNPADCDLSVLGRDVLGRFAVILDRPARVIHLLAGRHRYVIQES
jgi:predicted aspartyl protease